MPEKDSAFPEADILIRKLTLYHRGYAFWIACQDNAERIGIDPNDIVKYGLGWKDDYYATIKYSYGPAPWRHYFNIHKSEENYWFNLGFPLLNQERNEAKGNAGYRANLMQGKVADNNFLLNTSIDSSVWWKNASHRDLHTRQDAFPKSLDALDAHLLTTPDICFMYFLLPEIEGAKGNRYDKIPFHLPPGYIKTYI